MTWAEQVKSREVQSLSLSYIPLKGLISDTTSIRLAVKLIYVPYVVEINCKNVTRIYYNSWYMSDRQNDDNKLVSVSLKSNTKR